MVALKKKIYLLVFISVVLLFSSCIEEFDAQTKSFERLLVINALLTDEEKKHHVQLSRVFSFEEDIPEVETGARVMIIDEVGIEYPFEEVAPGDYASVNAFAAKEGSTYNLVVTLADGQKYISDKVTTPQKVPIDQLNAKRYFNDQGEEGVGIFLDNTSGQGDATFFRYEYEETYKIIAPNWDPFEMVVGHYIACDSIWYRVDIKPRTEEQRICFGTAKSNRLIMTNTSELELAKVKDFEIRFINRNNYIMSHRYSLLARQYSQTREAYNFYEALSDFSSSSLVFSNVQPGFLEGNIFPVNKSTEKVVGYFEVTSVAEKRMYFDYQDLFPNEELPPYAVNCSTPTAPQLITAGYHCNGFRNCDGDCESPLIELILINEITFVAANEDNFNQPYFVLLRPCGDCTTLGSNQVPEFWTE
jgi:hypothetical protein